MHNKIIIRFLMVRNCCFCPAFHLFSLFVILIDSHLQYNVHDDFMETFRTKRALWPFQNECIRYYFSDLIKSSETLLLRREYKIGKAMNSFFSKLFRFQMLQKISNWRRWIFQNRCIATATRWRILWLFVFHPLNILNIPKRTDEKIN